MASRLGSKTKVVLDSLPGNSRMPPALQLVYTMLVFIAESSGLRILMAAPYRELEPINLTLLKSEVAAAWADVSSTLRGFHELANVLIVLDEVLCALSRDIESGQTIQSLNRGLPSSDWPFDR